MIKNSDDSVSTTIKREEELIEGFHKTSIPGDSQTVKKTPTFEPSLVWYMCSLLFIIHLGAFYAIIFEAYYMKVYTHLFGVSIWFWMIFSYTGGVHRYWTHRSFKATLPLRVILLLGYTMTAHMPVYSWVKYHRMHHRYTDTDLDPHDSRRGLFYSHIGWTMLRRSPEYKSESREIDMSDILDDKLVSFHSRYFNIIAVIFTFIIPIMIPVFFWKELFHRSLLNVFIRILVSIHLAASVNSLAHIYGYRSYNRKILPTENMFVSVITFGEGWHNYHHVFPWDYKAGEFGDRFNFTAQILNLFAKVGWAYDLKSASPELVKSVWQKHGDGTHISIQNYDSKIL